MPGARPREAVDTAASPVPGARGQGFAAVQATALGPGSGEAPRACQSRRSTVS